MSAATAATILVVAHGTLMLYMLVAVVAAYRVPRKGYIPTRWLLGLGAGVILMTALVVWVTMYVVSIYPAWWDGTLLQAAVAITAIWSAISLVAALQPLMQVSSN